FEYDAVEDGMAVKNLARFIQEQVEIDNDRARWPCFFPSSVGMITSRDADGRPNLMPCGSTPLLSRHPLIIAPAVSYGAINERYKPRASLRILEEAGRFGCGVPFIAESVLNAIRYAGNVSIEKDPDKVAHCGLALAAGCDLPRFDALPVHFDCRIIGNVRLGTHVLFFGEVERIWVRKEVAPANPLRWLPWASVRPANG
ncbi:MAG: flavin reductase family protein, partial [Chthoniobacteraceae bacterium]